jgi:hypothetical protein
MGDIEVVTTGDRHDLDGQARDALLLDDGQVVAGGWGVPIRWDGTVGTLPDGYDGALVSAVTGQYVVPDALDLVTIDREQDRGTYAESNLWMRHV